MLYNDEGQLELERARQVSRSINLLLENVGHEKELIDFIYFANVDTFEVLLGTGKNREFY